MVRPEVVRHLDWIIFESLFQLNYSSLVCLFCSTLQYSTTLLYSTLLYSTLPYPTLSYPHVAGEHRQGGPRVQHRGDAAPLGRPLARAGG